MIVERICGTSKFDLSNHFPPVTARIIQLPGAIKTRECPRWIISEAEGLEQPE